MARQLVRDAPSLTRRAAPLATALGLLYAAQGVPFGIAAEYLPVVLRKAHYGYAHIAALFWLQLPWQLKVVWATAADHPRLRARTRSVILALQLTLAVAVATYAVAPFERAPVMWFVVTAVCALIASSQDVFVDAFAVRVLGEDERGFGNVAQVAGLPADRPSPYRHRAGQPADDCAPGAFRARCRESRGSRRSKKASSPTDRAG